MNVSHRPVIPRRLVVADLSLLQQHRGPYRAPAGIGLVLPRILLNEVLGKYESGKPWQGAGQSGKLYDLLASNPGQTFIGLNMGETDEAEYASDVRLRPRGCIDEEIARMFVEELPSRELWVERSRQAARWRNKKFEASGAAEFRRLRSSWKSIGKRFGTSIATRLRNSERMQFSWARHPARVVQSPVSNPKFALGAWARSLSHFPDRYSWPRWVRLANWYGLQGFLYAESSEERFRNDWFDAHYAHLASHVGSIASGDGELKKAVRAVFPRVQVLDRLPP